MSGLMGGRWRRGSPAGHPRDSGRCAEKRHHDGLVESQPAGHLQPRQRPTRLRNGNSSRKFTTIDSYVHQRLARLASMKHGRSHIGWASHYNLEWLQALDVYRLTGTIRWGSAHAAR